MCSWTKTLSDMDATEQVQLTDKVGEIGINKKFSVQELSEWRVFCIHVSNLNVFLLTI